MLQLLTGLAFAIGIGWGLASVTRWVLRGGPHCPACNTAMQTLPRSSSKQTYDVLACPSCTVCAASPIGRKEPRYAWCPSCQRPSLDIPCTRLPTEGGRHRVEVREHCKNCGHHHLLVLTSGGPAGGERGVVVPFDDRD